MPNEVKLLPCPFCGSADVRFDQIEFQIVCRNRDCSAYPHMFDTKAEAIAAWNTRPTTLVTDEVVERGGLRKEIARAIFGDDRNFYAMPESYHELSLYKAADRVIETLASMPTVVTGEPHSVGVGVPPSGSGHSRAEPEEVSALRASVPNAEWRWWAGRDEEWLTIGPCATREDAIAEALDDIGEGEGGFVVLEGIMQDIRFSASTIIDDAYEHWSDDSDLFSMEHDAPEPCGSKEDQKAAENELQTLLDGWVEKWRHTFPNPNMFAATRNSENVANSASGTLTEGGDVKQAPGESLSGPVAKPDAQGSTHD